MNVETSTAELRYSIKQKLEALPAKITKEIRKQVMDDHQISKATYYRYVNCLISDDADVPALVLAKFAQLFGCTIEDLFNQPKQ